MGRTSRLDAIAGATQKNQETNRLLVQITYEAREGVRQNPARMLGNSLVSTSTVNLPRRKHMHNTDKLRLFSLDIDFNRCLKKTRLVTASPIRV